MFAFGLAMGALLGPLCIALAVDLRVAWAMRRMEMEDER